MVDPASLKAIEALAAKIAPSLIEPAKGLGVRAKSKLSVRLSLGFRKYMEDQVARYSYVKTIISSTTPISLRNIYVNLFLLSEKTALRDDDFIEKIHELKNVLFTASAGSGKSMLMRYLYLHALESQENRLPIFANLRDINRKDDVTIIDLLASKVQEHIEGFSSEQLRYALKIGKVMLFLDGFDEIDHDKRAAREKELNLLASQYKDLLIFVSSRPAENFASWANFHVYHVQPFTKKQVELLLDKIDFDSEIKGLFTKKIKEGLYESHREFLINPLLTMMMLLTFSEFREIPGKIHLFYERAFDALYQKHDSTKEGHFERKRHADLAIDDFKRLFSYFCMISYRAKAISFSGQRLNQIIEQSAKASQIAQAPEPFKRDLIESTCILIPDGLDYVFSHRSFQEYFVAYFISRVKISDFNKFTKILDESAQFDSILPVLAEMCKEKFEEGYALPRLVEIYERISKIDIDKNPFGFLESLFAGEMLSLALRGGRVELRISRKQKRDNYMIDLRIAMYNMYGIFDHIKSKIGHEKFLVSESIEKFVRNKYVKNNAKFEEFMSFNKDNSANAYVYVEIDDTDDDLLRSMGIMSFFKQEVDSLNFAIGQIKLRVDLRDKEMEKILSLDLE